MRSVVAKDTMSAMIKLAREIEKSVSDVVGKSLMENSQKCMLVSANYAE